MVRRALVVSDLHGRRSQLDWVLTQASDFDLVVIAGDLLDAGAVTGGGEQTSTVMAFLEDVRRQAPLVVCSGNHDLDGRDDVGERAPRWFAELDELDVWRDGDVVIASDTVISVCPWWDGPVGAARLRAQLARQSALAGGRRWLWVHHAPAAGSSTGWDGRRDHGDTLLTELINDHRPDVVVSGHVHQAPFVAGGCWWERRGRTWLFNAGQQPGPVPAHLVVDLAANRVHWSAYGTTEEQVLEPANDPCAAAA